MKDICQFLRVVFSDRATSSLLDLLMAAIFLSYYLGDQSCRAWTFGDKTVQITALYLLVLWNSVLGLLLPLQPVSLSGLDSYTDISICQPHLPSTSGLNPYFILSLGKRFSDSRFSLFCGPDLINGLLHMFREFTCHNSGHKGSYSPLSSSYGSHGFEVRMVMV